MYPVLQAETVQVALVQRHVAWPPPQAIPQAPQFLMSVVLSTHVWLHRSGGLLQTQPPPTQLAPVGHELVQLPQCAVSVFSSTQTPPQLWSGSQTHAPPAQCVPAEHLLLHTPQLFESIVKSAQAPPQTAATSVPLAWQVHTPFVQSAPGGHCVPHEPQFCGSAIVLTHVETLATRHFVLLPVQLHTPMGGVPEG